MTVRSEGKFNTVVYDTEDRYRGISGRNATGTMTAQKAVAYPIKEGNIMMYYPESNILVPRDSDPQSKTPSFKSIEVILEKE